MDSDKKESIINAGWTIGDAADFLQMSEQERKLLEARVEMAAKEKNKLKLC